MLAYQRRHTEDFFACRVVVNLMMNSIMCRLYAKIPLAITDTTMQYDLSTKTYKSILYSYALRLTQHNISPQLTNYINSIRMASSADFRRTTRNTGLSMSRGGV